MTSAKLPPQAQRASTAGYWMSDANGNRIPVPIVELKIDDQPNGSCVLSRVTDTGTILNPTLHADEAGAKEAAADEFKVYNLNWSPS